MSEKIRILVVDDQEEILDVTSTVLQSAGYEVTTASGGAEGLDRLAREAFDLVLLDISMPGMDGWETLRLIRTDESLAGVPVVMFSIKGEPHDKIHGMQEGAIDYITKPFVVDELLARVRRVFETTSAGASRPAPNAGP